MDKSILRITKLTSAEGMTLTNGSSFSKEVYLGVNDSADNWWEITDAECDKIKLAEVEHNGRQIHNII